MYDQFAAVAGRARASCTGRPTRLRADHHARPARRHQPAHRRRPGPRRPGAGRRPRSVRPPYVEPVVLVDVPEGSAADTEETFGPTLTLTRVARRRRGGRAGQRPPTAWARRCSAAATGADRRPTGRRHGQRQLGADLRLGPGLPWGGAGDSGFGRIHGPDGLREFARSRAIARERFPIPLSWPPSPVRTTPSASSSSWPDCAGAAEPGRL